MERQLVQQLTVLARDERYRYEIITLNTPVDTSSIRATLPQSVTVTQYSFKSGFGIQLLRTLYTHFKTSTPDIVVSSAFMSNTAVRLLKHFFGYAVIAREHNVYPERTVLQRMLNTLLYWTATDVYVAVSQEAARAAEQAAWLPKGSVQVIENGIDIEAWEAKKVLSNSPHTEKEALGIKKTDRVVLAVARFNSKKRLDLLIDAFELFWKTHQSWHLVLVGFGEGETFLRAHAKKKRAQTHIHFVVGRYDVENLYAIADVYTLVSLYEGFPNVLLEALFFNVPIVATEAPGVSAVVTDDRVGRIVGSDPEHIAAGIAEIALWSKRERKVFGERAFEHIRSFDIKTVSAAYRSLFDTLLRR
ncbi:glycosyltransferase family 4 protein [Candidatus Kaiserbacteria bacterium]|nr:glycosyltransferase family 4 protein [Candidatus Kaiserbacteria bacterium]